MISCPLTFTIRTYDSHAAPVYLPQTSVSGTLLAEVVGGIDSSRIGKVNAGYQIKLHAPLPV